MKWKLISQVPKTEMEETFRFVIPEVERYSSTFVFRCATACAIVNNPHNGRNVMLATEMNWLIWVACSCLLLTGSRYACRQGNPLLPNDLRMVAAPKAAATVLVPDTSRCLSLTRPHAMMRIVVSQYTCASWSLNTLVHPRQYLVILQAQGPGGGGRAVLASCSAAGRA